jgi:hypothetical protein
MSSNSMSAVPSDLKGERAMVKKSLGIILGILVLIGGLLTGSAGAAELKIG